MRRLLLGIPLVWAACSPSEPSSEESEASPTDEETVIGGADGDLTIGPVFDGYELEGTAGGPQQGTELGPECSGFLPEGDEGNHLLVVEADQALTLVASPNGMGVMDLVMAIRLPDGSWVCADDGNDLDPVIARMFPTGEYRVYVGTQSDAMAPYQLTIRPGIYTPDPIALGGRFPPPVTDGTPAERTTLGTYGGAILNDGSAQTVLTGQAGGSRAAGEMHPGCSGWIAQVPDHVIDISDQMDVTFRVRSATDTTMLIVGPHDSKVCSDDEDGLNPVVRGTMLPGRYQIFVGTYEQLETTAEYTLSVSR